MKRQLANRRMSWAIACIGIAIGWTAVHHRPTNRHASPQPQSVIGDWRAAEPRIAPSAPVEAIAPIVPIVPIVQRPAVAASSSAAAPARHRQSSRNGIPRYEALTCPAVAAKDLDLSCARAYVVSLCAGPADPAALTQALGMYLGTHVLNVKKVLGRLNAIHLANYRDWCEVPAAQLDDALRMARAPKKQIDPMRAEYNRENHTWFLSDDGHTIDAGGYARAIEARRAMIETVSRKAVAEASTALKLGSGQAPEASVPLTAGLPSTQAGWTNATGYVHPVGRINDLLIDNVGTTTTRTMWAGTDGGGIWKTTNGGSTWTPVNDFNGSLAISNIVRSPRNNTDMYAATNPVGTHTYSPFGILKSTDGGVTWNQLAATNPGASLDWEYVTRIAIHPTGVAGQDVLLAATINSVYESTNSGTSWTKIATTRGTWVGFFPGDGNRRAYALSNGNFVITTNGLWASAFTYVVQAGATNAYTKFFFAASNANIMYAQAASSTGATTTYRSVNGGQNWTPITPPDNFFYNGFYLSYTGGMWVDPGNANRIVMTEGWAAATADVTTATGTTGWAESPIGWVDFHGATADPGFNGSTNKIVYTYDDGGLYRFTDIDNFSGGSFLALGMTITEAYAVAGRGGNLVLGAQDVATRFYRTAPPGDMTQKWRFGSGIGGHDGAAAEADRTNPQILYGATQRLGILRSTDGGATASFICNGITDINCGNYSGTAQFIAPILLDPNNSNTMLAGAASLWRSTNVTATPPVWSVIQSGVGANVRAIAIAPGNSNVIWVSYTNNTVYKTTNGTMASPTWAQVTTVPAGQHIELFIDRFNSNRVFVGLAGFTGNKLHVTPDAGATWSPVTGLPTMSIFAIEQHPANANWLYVGTAVGLFASQNGGASWSASNEGPANVQVRDLKWYSESGFNAELLVATFGRGIWRTTLNAGATLTVNKNGTGTGTVTGTGINCGADCTETVAAGTVITLTATPSGGHTFAGWSGGGCSGTGACMVTLNVSTTVTATFNGSATVPGAPAFNTLASGNMQATATFTAPASNGGSPITGYRVTCQALPNPAVNVDGPASPIVVTGLTNGAGYTCFVRAINAIGLSNPSNDLIVVPAMPALTLIGAQSRLTHLGVGHFIDLALGVAANGNVTTEPRNASTHQIVFFFDDQVTSAGTPSISNLSCSPASAPQAQASFSDQFVYVQLTNVPGDCRMTVSLANVNGSVNASVSLGFMSGDSNNSRRVTAADIAAIKAMSGNVPFDIRTARLDLDRSGTINAVDISIAKGKSGRQL